MWLLNQCSRICVGNSDLDLNFPISNEIDGRSGRELRAIGVLDQTFPLSSARGFERVGFAFLTT